MPTRRERDQSECNMNAESEASKCPRYGKRRRTEMQGLARLATGHESCRKRG